MIYDIYFDKNYGKLYEKIENGIAQIFECKTVNGKITNQYIKREIPIKIDNNIYYDIVTPYGYGGPIIEECIGKKDVLINEYKDMFEKYCNDNNIVSEFIRFHPIINNALDFKTIYDVIYMRKTLCTNLKDYNNPIATQFTTGCRNCIRGCIKKGITYEIIECPNTIDSFKEIYYSTMDRNSASSYYYFEDEYFDKLLKHYRNNVVLVKAIYGNKTIAMTIYLTYNKLIHMHLSGTLSEYMYLAPTYVLQYAITLWGKENGYEYIHLGGGRSNSSQDALYMFKRKFSKLYDCDFYIGKKIYNPKVYEKLCEIRNVNKDETYFPAYRK